jgi:hypothetical protein
MKLNLRREPSNEKIKKYIEIMGTEKSGAGNLWRER